MVGTKFVFPEKWHFILTGIQLNRWSVGTFNYVSIANVFQYTWPIAIVNGPIGMTMVKELVSPWIFTQSRIRSHKCIKAIRSFQKPFTRHSCLTISISCWVDQLVDPSTCLIQVKVQHSTIFFVCMWPLPTKTTQNLSNLCFSMKSRTYWKQQANRHWILLYISNVVCLNGGKKKITSGRFFLFFSYEPWASAKNCGTSIEANVA